MIIFSLKEDLRNINSIPDSGFFMRGDNNLCFLIHGLTGTAREMYSIGARLNKNGFSVASPMMYGHNRSLSVLKRLRWQEIYAKIKKEFLKYLPSFDKIYVAGLSFGSLIGLLLAYEFPEKVRAVNCFSPTLFLMGGIHLNQGFFCRLYSRHPLNTTFILKKIPPMELKMQG